MFRAMSRRFAIVLGVFFVFGLASVAWAATATLQYVVGSGFVDEQNTVSMSSTDSYWYGGHFNADKVGGPTNRHNYSTSHWGDPPATFNHPEDPNMDHFSNLSAGTYNLWAVADGYTSSQWPYVPWSASTGGVLRNVP